MRRVSSRAIAGPSSPMCARLQESQRREARRHARPAEQAAMSNADRNACWQERSRAARCDPAIAVLLALEAAAGCCSAWFAPIEAAAARLARGVRDLEHRADRQHGAAADPPPDRRRLGRCRRAGAASGGRHDAAGRARVRAGPCRAARTSTRGPPIRRRFRPMSRDGISTVHRFRSGR